MAKSVLSQLPMLRDRLRTLSSELDSAQMSWLLFERSVCRFEPCQAQWVDRIADVGISAPFEHVQMVCLHDAVSVICRLYDSPSADKICIAQTMKEMRKIAGPSDQAQLDLLEDQRKIRFERDDFQELRGFRNSFIGHRLNLGGSASYKYLPDIISDTDDLLMSLFDLAGVSRWIGQLTTAGMQDRADRFWNLLENSLMVK